MQKKKFSIHSRLKSFTYAFNGLKILITEEHNFRIHLVATVIVILISFFLQISFYEWLAIIFAISIVVISEIINTCIENICNFIMPDYNSSIKRIKDMSAALVLVSTITSIIIAFIVFLPKLF